MLIAEDLSKSYGTHRALDRLNLRIEPGQIYGLLGANGAGKTTTIHLFLGFLRPDAGRAVIDGIEVEKDVVAARRKVAYVPEMVHLYERLSGVENLQYLAALGGRKDLGDTEAIELLGRCSLEERAARKRLGTYSKGMRQKVGLAVALAKGAKVLLLDEPTSGLDPSASVEFGRILRSIADEGAAVLTATHDLLRARETGDRIGILNQGCLVRELDAAEIEHRHLEQVYLDAVKEAPARSEVAS